MFKLWKKYLKFYKKEVILGPLFKVIEAIFELIVPLVVAKIIDRGIGENLGVPYILKMGAILLALAIIGLSSTLVCQYVASRASQGVGTLLRNDLYAHLLSLNQKEVDEVGKSKIVTIINNDANQIQLSIAMLIRLVIRAPFLVIGASIMSMFISKSLGLIFIVSGLLIGLLIVLIMVLSLPHSKKMQKGVDNLSTITLENLQGARVVRAFNKNEYEAKRFNSKCDDIFLDSKMFTFVNAFLNPLTLFISNFAIILIIYLSAFKVNNGEFLQGSLISLVNYMTQISIAVVVVVSLVITFSKAITSGKRINDFFEVKGSIIDGSENLNDIETINFNNVSFSYYDHGNNVLNNIDFEIKKGETIGILGGTGQGKSTIAKLLNRDYDVSNGEILINGQNIKNYKLNDLHNNIALVYQKNSLFKGSIRENLKVANKDASDELIDKCLKIAMCYDFVYQKEGNLDYKLTAGGKNLSGGQKQRLCIARALLANPKVLILDDSSSALDYLTDYNLRKNINEEMKGITLIIISQRISSIKHANRILLVDKTRLVGNASHDELIRSNEVYQEIYSSQTNKEEE